MRGISADAEKKGIPDKGNSKNKILQTRKAMFSPGTEVQDTENAGELEKNTLVRNCGCEQQGVYSHEGFSQGRIRCV